MVIADNQTPLVVLAGQRSCGKTSVLVRLSRFLLMKGWRVQPIRTLYPHSQRYQLYCDMFVKMLINDDLSQWCSIPTILLEVKDSAGRKVCQLLEYDSERFLNNNSLTTDCSEVFSLLQGRLAIIPFIVDHPTDTHLFICQVRKMQSLTRTANKTIRWLFLYNKIDLMVNNYCHIEDGYRYAYHVINMNYPGLFDTFRYYGFRRLWSPYNCFLIPFSSGLLVQTTTPSGEELALYKPSRECFPKRLWDFILKGIK